MTAHAPPTAPSHHRRSTGRATPGWRSGLTGIGVVALLALGATAAPAAPIQAAGSNGQLREVRVGNDGAFDRIVFQLDGTTAPVAELSTVAANPGTVVLDPSGQAVPLAGASSFTVRMRPANATYPLGANGPPYAGSTDITPTTTANVVEVRMSGDFEGTLSWAIGIRSATTPKVSTLTNPVRIVVDVPHAATTATTTTVTTTAAVATPSFTG